MSLLKVFGKKFIVFALAFSLALSLLGCQAQPEKKQVLEKIVLTDDTGKKIVLSGPAKRVVSLAPANTEIIYALGGEEKLVGVTTYCDYPEEAKKKEKVGDFANPNVEKIISLKPQVVLATGGVQKGVVEKLTEFKIKVFVVDPKNFDGLFSDIQKIGKIIGKKGKAEKLVDDLKARVEEVKKKAHGLPKPKVFFEIYSQPLMTAGKNTFINDMIEIAGGINIGAQAGVGYPQFSVEQLIKENPDVYLAAKGSMNSPEDLRKRPGYTGLKAVKEGKVFVLDDNLVTRPGPRLIEGLIDVAKAVHPEVF